MYDKTKYHLLHYFVIGRSMKLLSSILEKSLTGVDNKDDEGRSALHIAALLNYSDIATELINKHADINLADKVGMTPLLFAANYGSLEVFEILLQNPATTVNVTAKNKNSVLHLAMKNNNTNILKILKKHKELMKTTHNVEWTTFIGMDCSEKKSALHYAVLQNNKESVEILLQEHVDVHHYTDIDFRTPLSYAAGKGLVEITKILVEHGARNCRDENLFSPIHHAAKNGHPEVVQLLVNEEFSSNTDLDGRNGLDIAIGENHEEVALVIVKSDNWKKFLQNTTGEYQTPMRKLIAHMPDVAREVFNRCTTVDGTGDEFSVNFDYELLDDTHLLVNKWKDVGGKPYTEDANEITRNHPLMIMVTKKRTELLDHPLVSALLKKKWTSIGLIFYLLNVFLYVLYLAMLTGFALYVQAPYKFTETDNLVNKLYFSVSTDVTQDRIPPFAAFAKYSVIVLTAIELIIEICEMTLIFSCNMRSYIMEKENVLQWIAYILSILFVIHPSGSTDTGYRPEWQWSCGTVSVFLAWINLLLLTQKFDWIGIYVVMLFRVGKVFMKFFLVLSFLIVAFAITFHCLLQNQEPFSTFWISLVKTTEMMIGELDYTTIFFDEKVHYNAISHVFFYIFMLFMTIVVVNLMLDRNSLEVIYKSFIRPILEYGDVLFDNCTQNEKQELEKIQHEAARIVTGTTKLVSIDKLLSEVGWETLANRRKKHKLVLFYKMKNNLTPSYLSDLVPSNVGRDHRYPLRNAENSQTMSTHTAFYYNSFLPSVIRDFNALPDEIRNACSLASFKRMLNNDIPTAPKYFLTGDGLSKEIKTLKREMKHMDAESRNEVRTINRDMQEEMKSMESRLQEKMKNLDAKLMTIIQNLNKAEDKSSTDNQQTVKL
ncbi:transient receptor potential cation channel subfamily A member 1 homolog [Mercenaria mercenaria]|uniref:transient receptor potential cation channel subfamily A member 1 homolog n=1 Tax=Mercenaria mercenaria TaxID=6596 RepID=UPI00234F83B1|nr:transient receptor potential cation channel subfamily A member 1 homolog [Mercenaria mercenaria]